MTYFEKIKQMSVKDFADFINLSVYEDEDFHTVIDGQVFLGVDELIDWLNSECEE